LFLNEIPIRAAGGERPVIARAACSMVFNFAPRAHWVRVERNPRVACRASGHFAAVAGYSRGRRNAAGLFFARILPRALAGSAIEGDEDA